MDSSLWYRTFTRGAKPGEPDQPLDDIDTVADNHFIQSHFTDKFGQWLTQGNNKFRGTLDGLLSVFFQDSANFKLQTYLVGDGTSIQSVEQNQWFNPHLRLVCVVTPPSPGVVQHIAPLPWLFFVVGSHLLTDEYAFLQVASWDRTTFRFYQRDTVIGQDTLKGWIYQGQSNDAFSDADQYLGPFNGHVNGACIMKEIHQPWIHWLSPTDDLANCFSPADITAFKNSPYLTKPNEPHVLAGATVRTADFLEPLILSGVQAWFKQRQKNDFFDEKGQLLTQPHNIKRWVAHLLLTTTINIAGASNQGFVVPPDHFLDNELLILESTFDLADGINVPNFAFDGDMYKQARTELGLCLMQELEPDNLPPTGTIWLPMNTLGEGKVPKEEKIPFIIARDDEGVVPFTILQSSIEDRFGAAIMQKLKAGKISLQLFSESTANALLMVDFWNPIYSWRRGRLMQYMPTTTTLTEDTYDLEANFIAAVKASDALKDHSSPEYAFVQLLNVSTSDSQKRIQTYLNKVSQRLKKYEGLLDYMKLAESRRRIYRPLPLDEFGVTLPYARNLDPSTTPWFEMTEQGTIQAIPKEGVDFLSAWIGSLAGFDPQLLSDAGSTKQSLVHPALLPKPANLPLPCQSARSPSGRAKSQGCPYLAKRKKSGASSMPAVATLAQVPSSAVTRKLDNADCPTWDDDISKKQATVP